MKHLLLLASAFVFACNSCAPGVVPGPAPTPLPLPPLTDAGPSDGGPEPVVDSSVRDACANLVRLGCREGGSMCAVTMQKTLNTGLTSVPLGCMVGAATQQDVRACGFVPCQ